MAGIPRLSVKEAVASLVENSSGIIFTGVRTIRPTKRGMMRCFMPCCEDCGSCHHHQTCEEFKQKVCSLAGFYVEVKPCS